MGLRGGGHYQPDRGSDDAERGRGKGFTVAARSPAVGRFRLLSAVVDYPEAAMAAGACLAAAVAAFAKWTSVKP